MAALGAIKYITIHCAATPEDRNVAAIEISKWDIAKFGQVSYHYVIELDGTVKPTLPLSIKGAHVGKANTGNIGICYVGGVDKNGNPKDTRTVRQKEALKALLLTLMELYPGVVIRGHRDWPGVKKACPSFDVASWLKQEGIE